VKCNPTYPGRALPAAVAALSTAFYPKYTSGYPQGHWPNSWKNDSVHEDLPTTPTLKELFRLLNLDDEPSDPQAPDDSEDDADSDGSISHSEQFNMAKFGLAGVDTKNIHSHRYYDRRG
jgi:hypothetical protein